jgi:hypothetical protein
MINSILAQGVNVGSDSLAAWLLLQPGFCVTSAGR